MLILRSSLGAKVVPCFNPCPVQPQHPGGAIWPEAKERTGEGRGTIKPCVCPSLCSPSKCWKCGLHRAHTPLQSPGAGEQMEQVHQAVGDYWNDWRLDIIWNTPLLMYESSKSPSCPWTCSIQTCCLYKVLNGWSLAVVAQCWSLHSKALTNLDIASPSLLLQSITVSRDSHL